MDKSNFHIRNYESSSKPQGEVSWRSPSNIALIKYWGKHGNQLPCNPSLSFSLKNSYTETNVRYAPAEEKKPALQYSFEGKHEVSFETKVKKFIKNIYEYFPFLKHTDLSISSHNTFPHSSGIASSASSMSALALCFCSIERQCFQSLQDEGDFYRKASFIARLGSGSASRSVYEGFSVWGENKLISNSSDLFAISLLSQRGDHFNKLKDYILLVDSRSKEISSTAGHALMKNHSFANARFEQAKENLDKILTAIEQDNWNDFADITENEALSLHAMMMTSNPSYILLKPNTLKIIDKIKQARKQKALSVCFTIDAGPNVHLIYPERESRKVRTFIEQELLIYCSDEKGIEDQMGKGPQQIK